VGEFSSHTKFEVRDDSRIRFKHDIWRGGSCPHVAFLDLVQFGLLHGCLCGRSFRVFE
jgi:hypothetical protein